MSDGHRLKNAALRKTITILYYGVVSFNLLFTAVGMIPGLEYIVENKGLWLTCVAALQIAEMWMNSQSRQWRFLLPILSAAILRLFVGAEGMGLWQCGLALANLILGVILFARARFSKKRKVAMGALSLLGLIPMLLLLLFTAIVGTSGITLRRYPDPLGHREAEVRIVDNGATGGNTTVTVYRSPLHLPFGTLRRVEGQTSLDWIDPDTLAVKWIDENTIELNGDPWRWQESLTRGTR